MFFHSLPLPIIAFFWVWESAVYHGQAVGTDVLLILVGGLTGVHPLVEHLSSLHARLFQGILDACQVWVLLSSCIC